MFHDWNQRLFERNNVLITLVTTKQSLGNVTFAKDRIALLSILFLYTEREFKICVWHGEALQMSWSKIRTYSLSHYLFCQRDTPNHKISVFKAILSIETPARSWCDNYEKVTNITEVVGQKFRNPFNNISRKYTTLENVLQIVFLTANQTPVSSCRNSFQGRFNFGTMEHYLNILGYMDTSMIIGSTGYQYLTCYQRICNF